jgi:hypothetical protein
MRLYRYELGSDDGVEDVLAGKVLFAEYPNPNDAIEAIDRFYAPTLVELHLMDEFEIKVYAATPIDRSIEPSDEALWILN